MKSRHVLIGVSFFLVFLLTFSSFCFADSDSDLSSEVTGNIPASSSGSETVTIETLRISPSDTSGFHAVVLGLLGDYNPIVKDYTYQSQQGYTSHSIDIQPDWSWISSAAIFLVIIFCTFRLVGGLFAKR